MDQNDEKWMNLAYKQAEMALSQDEVPIGAVIVSPEQKLISEAHNLKHTHNQATAHAEVLAIEKACEKLGTWRLTGCTLYVTLEPCLMCAGAILQARVTRVVFATDDPKAGACTSLYSCLNDSRLNHSCEIAQGPLKEQSSKLLKDFFKSKRKKEAL